MKKEMRIPIPNTRFILVAQQNEDTSWNISIFDPRDGTKKAVKKKFPTLFFAYYLLLC